MNYLDYVKIYKIVSDLTWFPHIDPVAHQPPTYGFGCLYKS